MTEQSDVFRKPEEVFADIDAANAAINSLNRRIQALSRVRSRWQNLKDDRRSELKAMADPDGHLPDCDRSGSHCYGNGWCRT